jgi:hypothetical protein
MTQREAGGPSAAFAKRAECVAVITMAILRIVCGIYIGNAVNKCNILRMKY